MAWRTTVADGDLILTSHEVSASSEEKDGTANLPNLAYVWAARLDTIETTDVWEADGYTYNAAKTWAESAPATRSRTKGFIDLGDGGGIISILLPYVARDELAIRSYARSNDAGAYKVKLTKTVAETTAVKL